MSDLRWEFVLNGDIWSLEQIALATQSRSDWQVVHNKEDWVLRIPVTNGNSSLRLNMLKENPKEFFKLIEPIQEKEFEKAKKYLELMTAILLLGTSISNNLSIRAAFYCDGSKRLGFFEVNESITISDRVSATVTHKVTGNSEHYPANELKRLLDITDRNHNAAEAISLLYQYGTNDWFSLYKIYEKIRAFCGGEKELETKLKVDKKELSKFTGSANHPAISGAQARHAVLPGGIPKSSMSLPEAKEFISMLLTRYLAHII